MYKYLVLAMFTFLISCNSDDFQDVPYNQLMEVQIDNETFIFTDEEFIGNENCGNIFLNAHALSKMSDFNFRINLDITTGGLLKEMILYDISNNNIHFKTSDFNASEEFFINNYYFSSDKKKLNFEFEGIVYEIGNEKNTKFISGNVDINNLLDVDCSLEPWEINAEINHNPFNVINIMGGVTTDQSEWIKSEWMAFSNDRFKISIITDDVLYNMPEGVYNFVQDDSLNRVTIETYTGASKAKSYNQIDEWEGFQYEGVLIIEEQRGFPPRTNGTFQMKAYKDDKLVYEVTNGTFSI